MIHITIPSLRTQIDRRDTHKKFTTFDLHVNGAFHASVRYSALYQLHEKLINVFGFRLDVPEFPPKKIWRSLDLKVINERRDALCNYFQKAIQNQDIAKHLIMEKTFLDFQVISYQFSMGASVSFFTNIDIYLPDGSVMSLECCISDPTNVVMKKFCEMMEINTRNSFAFGLFLGVPRKNGELNEEISAFNYICIRWLKNFESPYISQKLANDEMKDDSHKILIRRVTWDPSVEEPLMNDAGCLRMFYLQALNDVKSGVMRVSASVAERLLALKKENNFRQYMRLCHQQKNYGFELMAPVISDFPQSNTLCALKVGRRQLVLEYEENGITIQTILRSTRIRVWKVTYTDSPSDKTDQTDNSSEMMFQIEYLVGKQKFGVITLHTSQAVILSLFLQSIAGEILQEQPTCSSPTFKFDDSISVRAIERLEMSKANSIVADDYQIRGSGNTCENNEVLNKLFKIISYQMPFDNDSFGDVTDANL